MARVAYYLELEVGEGVTLTGSVMGPQMEPPAGQGPSSLATEHPQGPSAVDQVNHSQLAETQGQLFHLHKMEEDEGDQGPPVPVVINEEAVTSAAPSGQPRTPVSGDRRQAAGGPDGTTPRETAGREPEGSQRAGYSQENQPGTTGSGGRSCDGGAL